MLPSEGSVPMKVKHSPARLCAVRPEGGQGLAGIMVSKVTACGVVRESPTQEAAVSGARIGESGSKSGS